MSTETLSSLQTKSISIHIHHLPQQHLTLTGLGAEIGTSLQNYKYFLHLIIS